jgi:hypothetical protein
MSVYITGYSGSHKNLITDVPVCVVQQLAPLLPNDGQGVVVGVDPRLRQSPVGGSR